MHDTIASYGDDNHIARNLVATVSIIAERFQLCIGHVGSRRFFAALAVDAWMNEDFIYVRKFLLKSIILDFLQKSGANTVLQAIQDGNIHDRNSLFQLVKGVLQCQNQCLKSYLELCSDGACRCIGFAQMINDERQSVFSSSQNREAAEAHRVEREQERLPLVLKSSSEYWIVKKKAQTYLKSKQPERAKATYLEAKAILERHRKRDFELYEKDMQFKIGDEVGKIASNLSMICLMIDEKEEALHYASEAATACPGWSKAHCRRALALVALKRYNEAQVAIFNAMKRIERVISFGDELAKNRKELREYKKIEADIQAKLGASNHHYSIFDGNQLYKPLGCKMKCIGEAGSFFSLHPAMDIVYSFMTPVDVARLECTCKQFAIDPRGRRIALATRCFERFIDTKDLTLDEEMTGQEVYGNYICCVTKSPRIAIKEFTQQMRPLFCDDDVWMEYICVIDMDPLSLKTILEYAFDKLPMFLEFDDAPRDFIIAKKLMRDGKPAICGPLIMCMNSIGCEDEEGELSDFAKSFITHSLDIEVMRYAVTFGEEQHIDFGNLKESSLILLNNIILSMGSRLPKMNMENPVYHLSMDFHSLFTEHVPDEWPGVQGAYTWGSRPVAIESIKQYWISNPAMFNMWRLAIMKSLKWVHDLELGGHVFEYLLRSRRIFGEMTVDRQAYPINNFSFGPFLVMKAVEYGGSVSLSVKMICHDDYSSFFYDFYDFLHVFCKCYPALVHFMNTTLAEHHSYIG